MNKKLLIAAVGAAIVAAPMFAQADVKVGGYVNMSLDSLKGTDQATTGTTSKYNVSSNSSKITLSASDDLGAGMKAGFSMDTFFRADQNNGVGGANTFYGGNTALTLATGGGTVGLGTWDSGAKQNGRNFDPFINQLGDSRDMNVSNTRLNNLVFYVSPNMSGITAMVGHSTNSDSLSGSVTSPTTPTSTTANSFIVSYAQGPLSLGLGYDALKKNGSPAAASSAANSAKWTNLGGKYALDSGTSFILFYQKEDNATYVGGDGKAKKTTGIGVSQKFDNNVVKLMVYKLKDDATTSTSKLDAKMTAIGFDHIMSKSFTVYADIAKASNDANAAYIASGTGHGDAPTVPAGKSSSGFGVGAVYTF